MTSQTLPQFKIFDLYDLSEIKVEDPGLKAVINLQPKLILRSQGRNVQKFGQTKTIKVVKAVKLIKAIKLMKVLQIEIIHWN